jgi:hypothetical protein
MTTSVVLLLVATGCLCRLAALQHLQQPDDYATPLHPASAPYLAAAHRLPVLTSPRNALDTVAEALYVGVAGEAGLINAASGDESYAHEVAALPPFAMRHLSAGYVRWACLSDGEALCRDGRLVRIDGKAIRRFTAVVMSACDVAAMFVFAASVGRLLLLSRGSVTWPLWAALVIATVWPIAVAHTAAASAASMKYLALQIVFATMVPATGVAAPRAVWAALIIMLRCAAAVAAIALEPALCPITVAVVTATVADVREQSRVGCGLLLTVAASAVAMTFDLSGVNAFLAPQNNDGGPTSALPVFLTGDVSDTATDGVMSVLYVVKALVKCIGGAFATVSGRTTGGNSFELPFNGPGAGTAWLMRQLLFPRFIDGIDAATLLLPLCYPVPLLIKLVSVSPAPAASRPSTAGAALLEHARFLLCFSALCALLHQQHLTLADASAAAALCFTFPAALRRIKFPVVLLVASAPCVPLVIVAYHYAWVRHFAAPQSNMMFYSAVAMGIDICVFLTQWTTSHLICVRDGATD